MASLQESRFLLNVFDYFFTINDAELPRDLFEMKRDMESDKDTFLTPAIRTALICIIDVQTDVLTRVPKATLATYLEGRVTSAFSERDFLDFLGFQLQVCLTQRLHHPDAAIEAYDHVMSVLIEAKRANNFTEESWARLNQAGEEVIEEEKERSKCQLLEASSRSSTTSTDSASLKSSRRLEDPDEPLAKFPKEEVSIATAHSSDSMEVSEYVSCCEDLQVEGDDSLDQLSVEMTKKKHLTSNIETVSGADKEVVTKVEGNGKNKEIGEAKTKEDVTEKL